jgi:hypothetical protein
MTRERREGPMSQSSADAVQKIKGTIEFLIARKAEITIRIEGHERPFVTRITEADYGDTSSDRQGESVMVFEKLNPDEGNALLKSGSRIVALFSLRDTSCRFTTRCLDVPGEETGEGFVVSFPESIDVREKRRRDRRGDQIPEFVSIVVKLEDESRKAKSYELEIFDCTAYGVGILVRNKYMEILDRIEVGEKLRDVTLYGAHTIVKVEGTVRHKSKRSTEGEDFHVVGVEFDDPLKDFTSV